MFVYILLECCPSDAKNQDVLVIQEVIKEIAGSGLIQTSSNNSNIPFKGSFIYIVIIKYLYQYFYHINFIIYIYIK